MGVMTVTELDSSALRSNVAFTGRLACMTRAEAFEVVRSHGGTPSQAVTRQTKVLVVGELGWPLLDDGRPSNKLSKASSYGIPAVSERRFLEWIGKAVPDGLNRTYSAGQIATLSKLSHGTIEELVRFGLLNPRGDLFGFRDLASARQISNLFAHGISLSEILRSVKEIRAWLPEADICACIRPRTVPLKLNSRANEPTSADSLCCRSTRRRRMPMLYLSKHGQQRTPATLPKPSGCIVS